MKLIPFFFRIKYSNETRRAGTTLFFFLEKKNHRKLLLCAYKRTPRLYYNDTLTIPTLQKTDPNHHPKNSFYLISTIHYFFHHY
jgi:hypothetical protein